MDVKNDEVMGAISFPCHTRERVLVYKGTSGRCSIKCAACDRFALFDFDEMRAEPVKAARGALHNLKKE